MFLIFTFLLFESINLIWSSRNLEKPIEQVEVSKTAKQKKLIKV